MVCFGSFRIKSNPARKFLVTIMIVIEKSIRINQALIFVFQSRFD